MSNITLDNPEKSGRPGRVLWPFGRPIFCPITPFNYRQNHFSSGRGGIWRHRITTPGYADTQPFPAVPTKWTYKAIYCVGDAQVGQWSLPVGVTVGA